jgi:hypothetical protein
MVVKIGYIPMQASMKATMDNVVKFPMHNLA